MLVQVGLFELFVWLLEPSTLEIFLEVGKSKHFQHILEPLLHRPVVRDCQSADGIFAPNHTALCKTPSEIIQVSVVMVLFKVLGNKAFDVGASGYDRLERQEDVVEPYP
jgi:hypothetical protein